VKKKAIQLSTAWILELNYFSVLSINDKRMAKAHKPILELLDIKDPKEVDMIFDMVCANNYFAGQFDLNIPVDESREVFKHIKKLLKK
jgi:hypothetical protein